MRVSLVYLTVLVIATCGLVYELTAATLASYVLGDSVTQFSTIIGAYLSAMGIGSWLTRFIHKGVVRRFVEIELAVGLVGGVSAPLLFLAFGHFGPFFRPVLYGVVVLIGILVGLEIPLVLRILRDRVDFRDLVAQVLAWDYFGALIASLLFPIFMVPALGLVRTSLLFGIANTGVGLWSTFLFADAIGPSRALRASGVGILLLLLTGFVAADHLTDLAEESLYSDAIVFARTTRYQRIVLTRSRSGFQMFLNGNLQFSSVDEYRYHEALVHPAMAAAASRRRVLVLGGGDGLALREILRYPEVGSVTLVDLDPQMTDLARDNVLLRDLNRDSLHSTKLEVVNRDAFVWLAEGETRFDVVVVDFPDPSSFALGKLYTTSFYHRLARRLAPGGAVSVQSTSPLFARASYWCIHRTMEAAGFLVAPYHALVPSFGEWGFALAKTEPFAPPSAVRADLRYLDDKTLASLFVLPPDMAALPVEVNRLDNQALVRYYEGELARWQ